MSDKILCYDMELSRYFEINFGDVDKLIALVNDKLFSLGELSINQLIDIINAFLPEDNKMPKIVPWGDLRKFERCFDNTLYSYREEYFPGSDGRLIVSLYFDSEEDEEQ